MADLLAEAWLFYMPITTAAKNYKTVL